MKRLAAGIAAVVLAGLVMTAVGMRLAPDDPAKWHLDPLAAKRTDAPNDYMVAPDGAAQASPDRVAGTHDLTPVELMARFDAVAMEAPRTRRIAGGPGEMWATYVQRSAVFGFPDYVSARAVEVPGGSALAVWSRARFGQSDLGVNRDRVEDWLGRIGQSPTR